MLSRRTFLLASAATLASPVVGAAPASSIGAVQSSVSPVVAYAVGTPGEYDWQAIFARSPEEAFQEWVWSHHGDDEDAPAFAPECVQRVAAWDGKTNVGPSDWLDADMGYCCERCGCETHGDSGGRVVAGEVVCEECLTIADRCECDPEDVVEDLADRIVASGEAEVRAWLDASGKREVPDDIWARAVVAAREGAHV